MFRAAARVRRSLMPAPGSELAQLPQSACKATSSLSSSLSVVFLRTRRAPDRFRLFPAQGGMERITENTTESGTDGESRGALSALPGNPMIWILILSELVVFGAFFAI